MDNNSLVIVGAGIGGLTAAITAAERGIDVTLVEAGGKVGGAAAFSGGQVWLGANHVARREGMDDSFADTLAYVQAAAARDASSVDPVLCERWVRGAADAAAWLEQVGAIRWELIPDYPDYYFPDLPGARPAGRYLTGAPFDGRQLGAARDRLHVSPHFPVGITYGEMFAWGGMSSKSRWDWSLVEHRRAQDTLTFGSGIVGALFQAVLRRSVRVLTGHAATALIHSGGTVTGVSCQTARGVVDLPGTVILATGAHDWSPSYSERFTGIPPRDGGSVAPDTVRGDAMALAGALGAEVRALPAWAAPVLPGYRLAEPAFEGDTGYRACFEHCLPHTFLVNRRGERFCDDSFHTDIVARALEPDARGQPANLPLYMVWDEDHHARYGLGRAMPGESYPPGLVASAPTLAELAGALGIDADGLLATATRFNTMAAQGVDTDFGRGSNLSVRRFRGDWNQRPNPNMAPVRRAPFHGMRLRLLNTGIAAGGVRTDGDARALRADGSVVDGLYVVGEASARAAAGVGYNSGYSLSRAMAFGWIAAGHMADAREAVSA